VEWTDRGRAVRSEIDLPQCHLVYRKSYMAHCIQPRLRGFRPDTDRPSHGTTDRRGERPDTDRPSHGTTSRRGEERMCASVMISCRL